MDPVTGAHTQGIERCWKSWKDYVRRSRCVRDHRISEYLYAWVFVFNRTQSGVPRNQIINDILSCFVWNVSKFPEVSILWRDGSMKCFWKTLTILEEMTYWEMNFSTNAFISIFFSTVINISFKPRDNLGNTAGKPLFHHGNNTVLPWHNHGNTMVMSWSYLYINLKWSG